MRWSLFAVSSALWLCATAQNAAEEDLDPENPSTPGAKVVKIKSGPYQVGAQDMIENRPVLDVEAPCSDCFITALQGGLEYPDGSVANTDTGAWLHHMVLYLNGNGNDAVCPILPMQRIYASGNERSPTRLNLNGTYGIQIGGSGGDSGSDSGGDSGGGLFGGLGGDSGGLLGGLGGGSSGGGGLLGGLLGEGFGMLIDLMNMSEEPKEYILTMTYEFVEAEAAADYKGVTSVWLDVGGNCGNSFQPAQEGAFELKSDGWEVTTSGRLLYASGHEHGGGTSTVIYLNGEPICESQMIYEEGGGHSHGGDGGGEEGMAAEENLVGATPCIDFGEVREGDTLVIGAKYDTNLHALDEGMHGGEPEPIMGISRVYIGS